MVNSMRRFFKIKGFKSLLFITYTCKHVSKAVNWPVNWPISQEWVQAWLNARVPGGRHSKAGFVLKFTSHQI
jgi:hypothetical protein